MNQKLFDLISPQKYQRFTLWFKNPAEKREQIKRIFVDNSEIGQCPQEINKQGFVVFEEAFNGQFETTKTLGWGTYYIIKIIDELNKLQLNARLMKGLKGSKFRIYPTK